MSRPIANRRCPFEGVWSDPKIYNLAEDRPRHGDRASARALRVGHAWRVRN